MQKKKNLKQSVVEGKSSRNLHGEVIESYPQIFRHERLRNAVAELKTRVNENSILRLFF